MPSSNNAVSMLLINSHEFNPNEDISYNKPKVNARGGKNVPISNNVSKKKLYLSTPLMMTWGMNQNDYDNNGKYTYDFSLAFPREGDPNYTEKTQKFLENMQAFEEKILNDAYENRKDWFGKASMSKEVMKELFSPMLKYPKGDDGEPDKTRQPTLAVKVPYYDSDFKCELYNDKEEQVFPSEDPDVDNGDLIQKLVQKTQNIAVLLECRGIWFANGKFGVTWGMVQAVVKPLVTLKGRCHIVLDTTEKKLLNSQKSEDEEDKSTQDTTQVEDSDNEDDDDSKATNDESTEEQAKVVRKVKRARKKAA